MRRLIIVLMILISSQVYAQWENKDFKDYKLIYNGTEIEPDSTSDCFLCDLNEEEKVLKDEQKKITVKKKNEVVIFSIQTKNRTTNNITEKIDIRVDERTIELARKLLKILKTFQEDQ